jgi:hypothetical protein
MRLPKIPREARHLRTYEEFGSYLKDFANGIYGFVWVVGRPGTCKTMSIRAAVRGHKVYYRQGGQLTPARFYIDGYEHRGEPIILDDAEHLLDRPLGARLVSALGDTSPVKQLSYGTASRALGDVPDTYSTTSRLCIIANRVTASEAIQSRAVVLYFDPTSAEVHRAVARWYWDQEIHDWFGQHLHRLRPLDSRWYVMASADKRAGRDWGRIVLTTHAPSRAACLVQDLEADPAYPTRKDKARRFVEQMGSVKGASRATYFRLRKRLEDEGRLAVQVVPPITLVRTRPPSTPSVAELDSLDAVPPVKPEEESTPLDVPAREAFAQPIRGATPGQSPPPRYTTDDSLSWEARPQEDEDGDA